MAVLLIILGIFVMWAVFTGRFQAIWALLFSAGAG